MPDITAEARQALIDKLVAHACSGDYSDVERIIKTSRALIDQPDRDSGQPALVAAAARGREMIVNLLLRYSANSDVCDAEGMTALHPAARHGNYAIIKALLMDGADASLKTKDEQLTPLMLAARGGWLHQAGWLMRYGAHPADKASDGRTAADMASRPEIAAEINARHDYLRRHPLDGIECRGIRKCKPSSYTIKEEFDVWRQEARRKRMQADGPVVEKLRTTAPRYAQFVKGGPKS